MTCIRCCNSDIFKLKTRGCKVANKDILYAKPNANALSVECLRFLMSNAICFRGLP